MACTTTLRYCYLSMHLHSAATWPYVPSPSSSPAFTADPPCASCALYCHDMHQSITLCSKAQSDTFCLGASVLAEACSASDPYQLRKGTSSNSTAVTTSASCKLSLLTIRYLTYRFHCSPTRDHLIPSTMLYDIGTCVVAAETLCTCTPCL